ncbi:MAG: UDP-N-acetylmuramate:L-alanyl-gamma-D-glutamyl-meso-diaminopimelate ligase [SAR324 cluster bacterium]|nr:UDP-N-acetylmuramate:L-alanyl-gamma-D-glutamyl-meso-diaminopimelate ligase [SAR324 cluster bacterium]
MLVLNHSIKHIYFIGICGTAMASLAVLLKKRGYHVTGSDSNVYPPMSIFLEQQSIDVLDGYKEGNLHNAPDLVVIGNALSRGNPEVEIVLEQGIPYISMAELLKEFFIRGTTSMVVTGTHGKTTTTSLLAWIFECAGKQPGFMIGGIPENFGTSCQQGGGEFFITEGDEYDTAFFDKRSKFFHYQPHQLIINNIEFDHADIFDSLEDILRAFRLMLRLVPRNGLIAVNGDDDNAMNVVQSVYSPYVTFGFGKKCEARAMDLQTTSEGTTFHLEWPNHCDNTFHIPIFGQYNVRNAMGSAILALHNGIVVEVIQQAFDQFCNVKRRQELRGVCNGIHVYDDFAHHPTAVLETVRAIRQKHPEQRLIAVFEPRSNTSVLNIHQSALANSFEAADEVLLAYPHRMDQIPFEERLDVGRVAEMIKKQGKNALAFEAVSLIVDYLLKSAQPDDVILVMSNGKFDNIHQTLLDKFSSPAN